MSILAASQIAIALVATLAIRCLVWKYVLVPKMRAIALDVMNEVLSAERPVSFVQPLTDPQTKNLGSAVRDLRVGRRHERA